MLVDADTRITWVTFDSPQSRSLLASEADVRFVPRVAPRGYFQLLRALVPSMRLLRQVRPSAVYSTGAAIALAFLPFAWIVGARATYLESATRTEGPSVTGRLLRLFPWIALRTQYRSWAGRRWQYGGSVFDQWAALHVTTAPRSIRKLVVTLGTQSDFPFVSLVQRLQKIVPSGVEVRWQLGQGFPEELRPAGARSVISPDEMRDWVREADAVVAHAGVGSALSLLSSGCTPVLVPRRATRGEHVDEHQTLLANELVHRGLAVAANAGDLTWDDLIASTTVRVVKTFPVASAAGAMRNPARLSATAA